MVRVINFHFVIKSRTQQIQTKSDTDEKALIAKINESLHIRSSGFLVANHPSAPGNMAPVSTETAGEILHKFVHSV